MHQQGQLPQPSQQQQAFIHQQQQLMQQQQHSVMQPGANATVPIAGAASIPPPMMYSNPQQTVTVPQQQQQVTATPSMSQVQQPTMNVQQQQVTDNNPYLPANRLKFLVPELKQALSASCLLFPQLIPLQALLKVVAESSKYHLSSLESTSSTNESTTITETFNKEAYRQACEHFWSICDQMEQCFALLIEGERQLASMNFFLPVTVNTSGLDRSEDSAGAPLPINRMTLQYPQFIIAVKKQIDYSRTICERLSELSNSISAIGNITL